MAIRRGRCPACRAGAIFAGGFSMNPECPECGLQFDREPGYFTGAMYISYALGVPIAAAVALTASFVFPAWSFERVIGLAFAALVPLSPFLFRYSRILWIHFDRTVDP
jgi:uncharacterized protein (DUF983 family)